jgi:pimeloyl-ACP methyl ester carboxylesterase
MSNRGTGTGVVYQVTDERLPWQRDNPPIVFHHGVGARGDMWAGWTSALSERHELVRTNMRGHGGSTVPPGYQWTLESLAADLHAVVTSAKHDAIHLVGESVGGTVALAYTLAYPKRVRTLCISNGAHLGSKLTNLHNWADLMADGGMEGWSEHMMGCRFNRGAISRDAFKWYEQQQREANATAILDALSMLIGTDLSPRLHEINIPVCLMHPDASQFIPVSVMADLKQKLPDARLQVFANAKHGLPFSHASQCSKLYAQFLAERG